jgi:hypothetical protein
MPKGFVAGSLRVICLVVLGLMTSCSPQGPTISIEADSPAKLNEDVRVAVQAGNITGLTALEVHLSFDPAVLEVVRLEEGDLVKADFTVQNTFDNTAGTIDYAVAQIDRPPASGSGILFEIIFRARALGQSPIRFHGVSAAPEGLILADSNGMAIQVVLKESTVRVK